MIIVALIMCAVLVLDLICAAVFFRSGLMTLAAGFVTSVATLWIVLALRARRKDTPQHGWALGRALELSDPDHPGDDSAVISANVLNLGMLALGSPGAGKTESVMLGYLHALEDHSPRSGWAFFEGKGDIDIYKKCVAMGRPPDHFFSSELPGSQSINLFVGDAHDIIDRLGKILIGTSKSTSFYSDEQRAVLSRVIPLLCCLPVPTNLRDLYVALSVKDAGTELLRRARDAGASAVDISLAKQWFDDDYEKRVRNIAGLLNRLFVFVSGPYADRLNAYQPDIDIHRAVTERKSIYFHLPLTDFARDVAIACIELFAVEARKRQLAGTEGIERYPLLMDDWGAFFHDGFRSFSARCRSAAMPLSFGFQSRAQLEAVDPTYGDELDDTIATKIIMRVQGEATADYAVRLLGQYDTADVSTTAHARDSANLSMMRRYRIEPRDVRELQAGEAYVSTLASINGRTVNPFWKLRFPLPDFNGWKEVALPTAQSCQEGEGLHFWQRYMNPGALAAIHAATLDAEQRRRVQREADQATALRQARDTLARNPGLVRGANDA
jgi:hypothetical protein